MRTSRNTCGVERRHWHMVDAMRAESRLGRATIGWSGRYLNDRNSVLGSPVSLWCVLDEFDAFASLSVHGCSKFHAHGLDSLTIEA